MSPIWGTERSPTPRGNRCPRYHGGMRKSAEHPEFLPGDLVSRAGSVPVSGAPSLRDPDAYYEFTRIGIALRRAQEQVYYNNPMIETTVAEIEGLTHGAEMPNVRELAAGTVNFYANGDRKKHTGVIEHGAGFTIGRNNRIVSMTSEAGERYWVAIDAAAPTPKQGVSNPLTPAAAAGRGLEVVNRAAREFSSFLDRCGLGQTFVSLDLGDLLAKLPAEVLDELHGPDCSFRQMLRQSLAVHRDSVAQQTAEICSRIEARLGSPESNPAPFARNR